MPKTVLLVEDDEDDILFAKMACRRSGIPHNFHVVRDGPEALDYLQGKGTYGNRDAFPFPDLVFLDIKLPRLSGLEVLRQIREEFRFKALPVVMLTSSRLSSDVDHAYKIGVTSYIRKIPNPAEFGQAVRVVLRYWLEVNMRPLPSHEF